MIEIKKIIILLLLPLTLIIGIFLGYTFANTKNKITKTQNINNSVYQNQDKIIERKIENLNITAKEAINISYVEALKWSENASLSKIIMESKIITKEGTANDWKIIYYSKEKTAIYEITIKNGIIRGDGEEKSSEELQTLTGEIIDSTKLAESFYTSYPENSEIINLKMYYDKISKKFIWTIFFTGGSHTIKAEL